MAEGLNDFITAHDTFLSSIVEKAMLGETSAKLLQSLDQVVDSILSMGNCCTKIHAQMFLLKTKQV